MRVNKIESLADLLAMLSSGGVVEPEPLNGTPEDVTAEDMARAQQFLTDLLACKTIDDFKNISDWINHWHREPGLKANDFRHAYVHALMELPPLLAIVRLGPIALTHMESLHHQ